MIRQNYLHECHDEKDCHEYGECGQDVVDDQVENHLLTKGQLKKQFCNKKIKKLLYTFFKKQPNFNFLGETGDIRQLIVRQDT